MAYMYLSKVKQLVFPTTRPPNILLRLSLKEQVLDQNLCRKIQRGLKLDEDLTTNTMYAGPHYTHYSWKINVKDPTDFKERLNRYLKSHPELDFHIEETRSYRAKIQYILYAVGLIASVIEIMNLFG